MKSTLTYFVATSLVVAIACSASSVANAASPLPKLKVSENKRFLTTETGAPFFWLGDTAWELFHRSTREEALQYLDARRAQGFNVVQAVAIAELGGLDVPNRYGFFPFVDKTAPTPDVKEGAENDYWDHVDFIVDAANERGIYVGFLPSWGAYWKDGQILTPENAEKYGEWLGRRYKEKGIVWILGGDRTIDNARERATVEAIATGLRRGDGGAHLITFHPRGGGGSSEYFKDAPWFDFHMRQNGHNVEYGSYAPTTADYALEPTKPVLDGEPIYEDHPVSFNPDKLGHSIAADCRRAFYWDVFNGAFGHTYGHHSIWQFYDSKREGCNPINRPLFDWRDALARPGASQMKFGKALIESRPFLTRIPDSELIAPDENASSVPGAGTRRFVATRDKDGTFAFVYFPVGRAATIRTSRLAAKTLRAYWFDPRTGKSTFIDEFANDGERRFEPPTVGEALDWVLVLDDSAKKYPTPGTKKL